MTKHEKVLTYIVDFRSASMIKNKKKLKKWLRLHPNFEIQTDDKYHHCYEREYNTHIEEQQVQQRSGNVVQLQPAQDTGEGGTSDRGEVPSGAEGGSEES